MGSRSYCNSEEHIMAHNKCHDKINVAHLACQDSPTELCLVEAVEQYEFLLQDTEAQIKCEDNFSAPAQPPLVYSTPVGMISVSSHISFSDLSISTFDDETFASEFAILFKFQMAHAAQVLPSAVTILQVRSGSVVVESAVYFDMVDDSLASNFEVMLITNAAAIFTIPSFQEYGNITSANVVIAHNSTAPPDIDSGADESGVRSGDSDTGQWKVPLLICVSITLLGSLALYMYHRKQQQRNAADNGDADTPLTSADVPSRKVISFATPATGSEPSESLDIPFEMSSSFLAPATGGQPLETVDIGETPPAAEIELRQQLASFALDDEPLEKMQIPEIMENPLQNIGKLQEGTEMAT
eukprot:gene11890-14043_t